MMQSAQIDHYEARAVFRGLFDGEDYRNRVAGACIYQCPRCGHRIRFRWRSFYQADGRSAFKRRLRGFFDDLTPALSAGEQGFLDFYCPTCSAPTRIIFSADDYTKIAYHFDVYAALVGEGKPSK
jgi:DNA-directed RNA polymerase subunit RPC12/RpoP